MVDRDLMDRLRPLNRALQKIPEVQLPSNCYLLPNENSYDGVVDGFFPEPPRGNARYTTHYVLWLDQLHGSYRKWKGFVSVKKDKFLFTPTSRFQVRGDIISRGNLNDFSYYFVLVKRLKHPNLSREIEK